MSLLSESAPLVTSATSPATQSARGASARDVEYSKTLMKGLGVLQAFAGSDIPLTNAEIATRINLPRPTVARLTSTLVELGYLVRSTRGRFQVGARALTLGYPVVSRYVDRQKARPFMREFAQRTGGAVSIAVASDMDYVFVESVRETQLMLHVPDVGFSAPLASTAMGRALLAAMPDSKLRQYRQRMVRYRPDEWREHGESALAAIEECRTRGYCSVFGTWRPEVLALASPLGHTLSGEALAINCGLQSWMTTPEQIAEAKLGPRLDALARCIRALIPLSLQSDVGTA